MGSRSDFPWPVISIVTLSNNSFGQQFRPTVPPSRETEMDLFPEALGGVSSGKRGKSERDGFDRKLYKAVSRVILYFIFELHADWTRTLTALVVMLYNALSLSLSPSSCASSLSFSLSLARSTPLWWITRGKGGPIVRFFAIKYEHDEGME